MEPSHPTPDDLHLMASLEPERQAALLAHMAQEARLVRLALPDDHAAAQGLALDFERALEQAIDAEDPSESDAARGALVRVLHTARSSRLRITASVSELEVDGILGTMKLPVLTAIVSPD